MVAIVSSPASPDAKDCLNCGARLHGRYCAACGQAAVLKPLSLWSLLKDLVEDVWDVDSKAWQSLLPLMFRPGRLTNEYLVGRRASFVAPLRLYLTASVLFFIIAALTDTSLRIAAGDPATERQRIEAAGEQDATNVIIAHEGACDTILADADAEWVAYWRERARKACERVIYDKGRSLERAALDNIPIMMVVFIPVLAMVMKLLYPLSKRYYVEHLVFFLHYHAFGFFVLALLIPVYEAGDLIGWSDTAWRAVSIPVSACMAIYLLIAMRQVYGQGYLTTTAKYFILFMVYVVGLVTSLTGLILYTALTL